MPRFRCVRRVAKSPTTLYIVIVVLAILSMFVTAKAR